MRSVPELRAYVYDFLDVEEEDVAPSLINAWIQEGYDKIVKAIRRFPHFERNYTLVATGQEVSFPADLDSVAFIAIDNRVLHPIGEREAIDRFSGYDGNVVSGNPTHYSVFADVAKLWPAPSSTESLDLNGWRKPTAWVSVEGAPDMPAHFEGALLSFLLYRAYGHQGMLEEASIERGEFEGQVSEMLAWENEDSTQQPMILGGVRRRPQATGLPYRLG